MIKKKVIVFGGGNGSAISLVALKQNIEFFDITAAISMSDSGGSSGKLRQDFQTLPPGDIMRAVLALSKYDYLMLKDIFYTQRFENCGKLSGHNLGNLFFALSSHYDGDFVNSLQAFSQSIGALGKILPTTLEKTNLVVTLDNGQEIFSESEIDRPEYDRNFKIEKIRLEPPAKIYLQLEKEIEKADYIIIGPGSLYTSLISSLLPIGIKEAIEKSSAKLIYVSGNAYEKLGETGPEIFSETVTCLEEYLPRPLDIILSNIFDFDEQKKMFYENKNWALLKYDPEKVDRKIITFDFEKSSGGQCAIKLGNKLKEIIK